MKLSTLALVVSILGSAQLSVQAQAQSHDHSGHGAAAVESEPVVDLSKNLAGCQASDFVAVEGDVQVVTRGMSYSPKCLKIKKGATVTIAASGFHPLQGIQLPGVVNPLFDPKGVVTSAKPIRFEAAGLFGYFCVSHGDEAGNGVAGAIIVE